MIHKVPKDMVYVVERFWKYKETWESGYHFYIPIIDRVVKKISKNECYVKLETHDVVTTDNKTIALNIAFYFHVLDPKSFTYKKPNLLREVTDVASNIVHDLAISMDLQSFSQQKQLLENQLRSQISNLSEGCGIKINNIEIENIMSKIDIKIL